MAQKIFNLLEKTTQAQTHKVTIPNLKSISTIVVDRGTVTYLINGDEVTITVNGGASTRRVQTGGSYTKGECKLGSTAIYKSGPPGSPPSFPSTTYHSRDGYSGYISIDGPPSWGPSSGKWTAYYSGQICLPDIDTRTWRNYYQYNVTINYIDNTSPTVTLATSDNRTLYENDKININGNAKDLDVGDVVTVRYSVNNGTPRAITSTVSTGANIPFAKELTFKNREMFDGELEVAIGLIEGTNNILKVWSEDDKGGKSVEQIRYFKVVPSRPPQLTLYPEEPFIDLISSDTINIRGNVVLLDENGADIMYEIDGIEHSGGLTLDGAGGEFVLGVDISKLPIGKSTLTINAVGLYGNTDSKELEVNKSFDSKITNALTVRYKLTPLSSNISGVVLWVEKSSSSSSVEVDVSVTNLGEAENFVPMIFTSSAPTLDGSIEDEFTYQVPGGLALDNIIFQITMSGGSEDSIPKIMKVSGVVS